MNFPKLSKIFRTRKQKNSPSAANVPTASTQGPKAKGQTGVPNARRFLRALGVEGLVSRSIHAGGINSSTAGNISSTAQKSPSWLSNLQSKIKNQQFSLDDVTKFLVRYLHCTDHQRNLLALWALHSHCFSAFDYTPYLSVHSTKAQSGKTRCLQLLSLLCPNPALTASVATNNLSSRIHYSEQRPTFLLDQCHSTVGSRRRSKNPVLRAILESGFQRGLGHTDRKGERDLFSPKAFAGIGLLPEDLAERSIPVHLDRLPVSVNLQNFRSEAVEAEAEPLRQWLAFWGQQNLQKLKSAPALDLEDFPSGIELSPRRKDLFEPLLQVARLLAGDWPKRATEALTFVFQDQAQRERKHAKALLYELREAFSHYGQPEKLATASLLIWLHHDPDAPWNQEGLITSSRLAAILRPFNIFPRQQKKKGEANHRGYTMQNFLYTWDQLLPREPSMNRDTSRREPMPNPPQPTPADEASVRAFKASEAQPQQPGSPNKNAGGINSSTRSEVSQKSASSLSNQQSKINNQQSAAPLPQIDPRIKGILGDPYNYYRQYPVDDTGKLRYLIEGRQQWPQPADDRLPPDALYSMSDGTHIPFTLINRHPTDPKPILGLPQFFTQRWPVTLNTEERMQVAMARFYELRAATKAELEKQKAEQDANTERQSAAVS